MVKVIIKKEYDIREIYKRWGFGSDNYLARQVFDRVSAAIRKEVELRNLPYNVIISEDAGSSILEFRDNRTGEVIAGEEAETEEIKKLLNELDNVIEVNL